MISVKVATSVALLLDLVLMLMVGSATAARAGTRDYNVTVVTDPSSGPYVLDNTIQFSCVVDPLPPEPVTYRWNYLTSVYGSSSSSQNISYTPRYRFYDLQVRFGWFFCNVLSNETLIATGKRLVEYQGFVYATEPLDRTFVEGEDILLRVNISDRYFQAGHIQALTWYHNGTEVIAGGRISARNNGTELHIRDMVSSDAGIYQVKVTALDFSIPECDATWLPLLWDYTAMLAPVTFVVSLSSREGRLQYDPTLTLPRSILHHYVTEDTNQIEIREQLTQIDNVTLIAIREYGRTQWYYNGVPVSGDKYNTSLSIDGDSLTLSLVINNATKDDIRIYIGTASVYTDELYQADSQRRCYSYFSLIDPRRFYIPMFVAVTVASVELYESPRLLFLSSESQSLRTQERTVLSCSAIGGKPDTHNLTLMKNNVTLRRGQGTVVSYTTSASSDQFGTYTCIVESLYTTGEATLLLEEKAYFQLLINFDDQGQCEEWIKDAQKSTALIEGIKTIVNSQCRACNLTVENFREYSFDCSASLFSSALVYSDSQGRVTATSLIQQYLKFLIIEVDRVNTITITTNNAFSCVLLNSGAFIRVCPGTSEKDPVGTASGALAGTFFGGLLTGVLLCLAALGIGICILKHSPRQETNTSEATEPEDMKLNSNEAYQMVNVRYQSARRLQQQIQENEPVYEQPAAI